MSYLAFLGMFIGVAIAMLVTFLRTFMGYQAPPGVAAVQAKIPVNVTPQSTVPSQVAPSAKYMDCTVREGALLTVDTWVSLTAFNAVTEGPVNVPSSAKYLSGMEIAIGCEQAGAVSNKISCMVRLSGAALTKGGRYHFLGPMGTLIVESVNGSNFVMAEPVFYPLAIPVKGGDQINVEAQFTGDDPTDIFIGVRFIFSDVPAPGGFVDGDVREADITTVNTDYGLTNVGADSLGYFRVPSDVRKLEALAFGSAWDPGIAAAILKCCLAFQLRGDALTYGGNFRFLGDWGSFVAAGTPVGGTGAVIAPRIVRVSLPLTPGNTLEAHAIILGETVPGEALVGVLYA